MSKKLKITLSFLGCLIGLILLDTFQAKLFNNSPFIHLTQNYNEGNILKINKGLLVNTYVFTNGEKKTIYRWVKYEPSKNIPIIDNQNEEGEKMQVNVIINNEEYILEVEDNETAKSFITKLPQEYTMKELNGNEKYVYLDYELPTNSINPKKINKGDVMLYGDNCLVIFYKTFNTNYSYTKIGHIANLADLGIDSITVKFTK